MKRLGKNLVMLATVMFSFELMANQMTTPAAAETGTAKITKVNTQAKTAYRATNGPIYQSATLTKKVHNAKNYPQTIFYSSKHVTVKKTNGKTAIYYYIANKSNTVKGYIWHGYLTKTQVAMSQKSLVKLINAAPDMDPDESIRSLKPINYEAHEAAFDLAYNVFHFSPTAMFKDHQALVYVTNPELRQHVQNAMNKWNNALGETAFRLGTKNNHTLKISFGNGTKEGWDGLYNGKQIYIDKTHYHDAKYPLEYMKPTLAAKFTINQYWDGVVAHELGHTLGLDHTGYQADLMYAATSSGNMIAKYIWKKPVEKSANGLDGTEMATISIRDLNRAKLTKLLGYW
ncbi:matrixin family metalloprotease [Lentilactobacillus otakiensis]|uniref:Peptidase M10A and M12B matrixinand adamalysin n=1 Tax=Lentilactobacillus otakiensis DSM 19908 = JCM 15040 TaxID=1423780 RepID=S4NPJ3_9LACO|nr:matrixin family metalloprotease [Lentilactobacillus otakiensis]KRL08904.1 peptidase M10A and M12B matrixin and adamalysin [Lentilactobacillus otakiensis DSM 19908 = JCM 15040]MBZ3775517.1 matrixin family metalloprotease [Lentilactobacillus otakiensis]MDV3518737.1 matrixin family metalloprotease [Lentilactobacillus otakiensis]GAD17716.1 peptidase M10A and M12B matrixinand adamalysin [Lentilactobacillus otakiensis DSM 19908 = JCM 15040]